MIYPEKIKCNVCGEEKTHENFYWKKDGNPYKKCKKCFSEHNKIRRGGEDRWVGKSVKIHYKECYVCGKKYIARQLNNNYCSKDCYVKSDKIKKYQREYQFEWRNNNPKKVKEYRDISYIKNIDVVLKRGRDWKIKNKHKVKEYRKNYHNENYIYDKEKSYEIARDNIENLRNVYIINRLKHISIKGKKIYISNIEIPQELIEVKRANILLKRGIKQLKQKQHETTKQ